jgi:hypothetical protein
MQQYASYSNPFIYYSGYYPKFSQSICSDTNAYYQCRAYSQFNTRRYFLVAQIKGTTSVNTFDYTGIFPESKDYNTGFYNVYVGWTRGGTSSYYATYTFTANKNQLTEATPAYGVTVPLFGNTLRTYSSPFVIKVNLNGFTLYNSGWAVGPNIGSFIQVTASSFTTLYGCGAYLYYQNQRSFSNNALYCVVVSNTVLKIYSNADITFTGELVITFSTSSVPASTTIQVELFDKYVSGSDYGRAVLVSQTISNNPAETVLPSTNLLWRRMVYREMRSDAAPLRATINNNYQYVSVYSTSTNSENTTASNALLFDLPSTVASNQAFKCTAREYPSTKQYLYREYNIPCSFYSTSQVTIQSIPSHALKPDYYYDFTVYQNRGSSSPLIALNSNGNYHMRVWSGVGYGSSSFTTTYYDVRPIVNYLSTSAFTLNSIYLLSR